MLQLVANGLCRGSVYALVAIGFGLIYSTTGVFHIAHGAVYVLAAYACYSFLVLLKLPLAIAITLSLLIAGVTGMLIEMMVYRPLEQRGASPAVSMISSLGVFIILINIVALFYGNQTQVLRPGVEATVTIGQVILTRVQIAQLIVSAVVITFYWLFLIRHSLGRICRAVADDSSLAAVLGIRVEEIRLVTFFIGSVLAGIETRLFALDIGTKPHMWLPIFLVAIVACLVGRLYKFIAPALGGILLGLIQSLAIWVTEAKWEEAVTFIVLITFLILRPQGLLGMRKRIEEK